MHKVLRNSAMKSRNCIKIRGGGPAPPPFARLPPPDKMLSEESELVWNDGVAPELCIDFDAPNYSRGEGLALWGCGMLFFTTVYALVYVSGAENTRMADKRQYSLPDLSRDFGLEPKTEEE